MPAAAELITPLTSIVSASPLTLDFLLRQGMQALEIQRRFAGASPPVGMESSVGDSDQPGSALGRMTRGGGLGFIVGVGLGRGLRSPSSDAKSQPRRR